MFQKSSNPSFRDVALALILSGVLVSALGLAQWVCNTFWYTSFAYPSLKVIGGAMITALGYIQLELEFLRKK